MKAILATGLGFILFPIFAFALSEGGGAHGAGNGGDMLVGREFYEIMKNVRATLLPTPHAIEWAFLPDTAPTIIPVEIQPRFEGVPVDALSTQHPRNRTEIFRTRWHMMNCFAKTQLTLHELFVLRNLEHPLSYPLSSVYADRFLRTGVIDCRKLSSFEEMQATLTQDAKKWDYIVDELLWVSRQYVSTYFAQIWKLAARYPVLRACYPNAKALEPFGMEFYRQISDLTAPVFIDRFVAGCRAQFLRQGGGLLPLVGKFLSILDSRLHEGSKLRRRLKRSGISLRTFAKEVVPFTRVEGCHYTAETAETLLRQQQKSDTLTVAWELAAHCY